MNDIDIIEKYCNGSHKDREIVTEQLLEILIPKACTYMFKNQGKDKQALIEEVAWYSLTGKGKLLDKLCLVEQSIEAYYMTIIRNEWPRFLGKSRQQEDVGGVSENQYFTESESASGMLEIQQTLDLIRSLRPIYHLPVLMSALGFSYADLHHQAFSDIRSAVVRVLEQYGINAEGFELKGDIFEISNDTYRQRLSQGRQRLKMLFFRHQA